MSARPKTFAAYRRGDQRTYPQLIAVGNNVFGKGADALAHENEMHQFLGYPVRLHVLTFLKNKAERWMTNRFLYSQLQLWKEGRGTYSRALGHWYRGRCTRSDAAQ